MATPFRVAVAMAVEALLSSKSPLSSVYRECMCNVPSIRTRVLRPSLGAGDATTTASAERNEVVCTLHSGPD